MSTDSITLTGLRITAHHGVFDFERREGQEFVIDVTVWLDFRAAASGDDLAVDLIETLAERIADVALAHEAAERVRVTVHKPQAPIEIPFADVAVQIERVQRASPAADHGAGRRAASEGSRA
jgi:dihydroneopterin aldolase